MLFPKSKGETEEFIRLLPFELTEDQNKVKEKIKEKTKSGARLNILLQGDVGSGKTVMAFYLMTLAAENGYQSVMMAPRSVLARQHYESFLETTGKEAVFLHSGMKVKERRELLKKIKSGEVPYIIGTHSCLSDDVEYKNLGAIITDEEHLFGVEQKEKIIRKANEGAHQMSMSATPIPRTLANVLYGENKEIEIIKSMPKGRLPIKTCAISQRKKAMDFMLQEIAKGRQCYVVCPAIEENEKIEMVSIESIESEYRNYFEPRGYRIVVANGKMDKEEAEASVSEFAAGKANILISTTVIEVGVNVPNASAIVIEQAERFGLASLHQLRGRVGRGIHQSYCILLSDDVNNERLQTICSSTDGFVIAEADMKQRGTGNLLGIKQAGQNKYIEMMFAYPDEFREARDLAKYCVDNDLGEKLVEIYREHEIEDEKQ